MATFETREVMSLGGRCCNAAFAALKLQIDSR